MGRRKGAEMFSKSSTITQLLVRLGGKRGTHVREMYKMS